MKTNAQIATAFRAQKKCPKEGFVIIYNNQAVSWMSTLHDPARQSPGCIAINNAGEQWIATGGDDYHGAREWNIITSKTCTDYDKTITRTFESGDGKTRCKECAVIDHQENSTNNLINRMIF